MIEVNTQDSFPCLRRQEVISICRKAYKNLGISLSGRSLSVGWVSRARIKTLNRIYRGKNVQTNILSFSYNTNGPRAEGEIILCPEVLRIEARALKVPVRRWAIRLLIHGLLHLEGHVHDSASDRVRMELLEQKLLQHLGIPATEFFED